jgi:hypothetical protein
MDEHAPINAGHWRHSSHHRTPRRILARRRLTLCQNGGARRLERFRGRIVRAPQHQADVGVSDQAARLVEHESLSALADADGRDDVPDQL